MAPAKQSKNKGPASDTANPSPQGGKGKGLTTASVPFQGGFFAELMHRLQSVIYVGSGISILALSEPRPAGSIAMSYGQVLAGAQLPLSEYSCRVLSRWRLAPGSLSGNAWRTLADAEAAGVPWEETVHLWFTCLKGDDKAHGFKSLQQKFPDSYGIPFQPTTNDKTWKDGWFWVTGPWNPLAGNPDFPIVTAFVPPLHCKYSFAYAEFNDCRYMITYYHFKNLSPFPVAASTLKFTNHNKIKRRAAPSAVKEYIKNKEERMPERPAPWEEQQPAPKRRKTGPKPTTIRIDDILHLATAMAQVSKDGVTMPASNELATEQANNPANQQVGNEEISPSIPLLQDQQEEPSASIDLLANNPDLEDLGELGASLQVELNNRFLLPTANLLTVAPHGSEHARRPPTPTSQDLEPPPSKEASAHSAVREQTFSNTSHHSADKMADAGISGPGPIITRVGPDVVDVSDEESPIDRKRFPFFNTSRHMESFLEAYMGEASTSAPLEEVADLTVEHIYLALMGSSAIREYAEDEDADRKNIHVPAALLAPERFKDYLREKIYRMADRNKALKAERDALKKLAMSGLEEKVKELTASLAETKEKLAKAEEAKATGEETVRQAFAEVDRAKLELVSVNMAAKAQADIWEKERKQKDFTIGQKNAAITKLKEALQTTRAEALSTAAGLDDAFRNTLASFSAVGYYFANRARILGGEGPLEHPPTDIPPEHIEAMKAYYLERYSRKPDAGGA